jgi:GNAT superfamily N-acetyltransferase
MPFPTACNIRPAGPSDAERLFEIRQQAILELAVPLLSTHQADDWAMRRDLTWMNDVISTKTLWVAFTGSTVTGWVAVEERGIIGLYVDPVCACRGIGSRLLAFAEDQLLLRGVRIVELEASRNAEEFYLRRGYQPTAERSVDGARPMQKLLG